MIILRKLKESDAEFMLEWMQDKEIQKVFRVNMKDKTIEDARKFCESAVIPKKIEEGTNIHFAIADEKDEYLGTISLKNISIDNLSAEYAISTRKKVHGKGIAKAATELILKKAFIDYGLHRIYLNVLSTNIVAIRLYEKCGFKYEGEFRQHFKIKDDYVDLKWYAMLEDDYCENNSRREVGI